MNVRRLSVHLLGMVLPLFATGLTAADKPAPASPQHWAWQPLRRPIVPEIGNPKSEIANPIDRFLLAKLAEKNLTYSPPADPRTLIRRLYFTTIGLPPTPEEVAEFEREFSRSRQPSVAPSGRDGATETQRDRETATIARLVDRLLASPHFGERWARHWLDVVRFAESNGYETNGARKNAWPYRDWVIRAFNKDLPYDRFIAEQLAGDALGADEATGFIVGGPTDVVKSPDPVLTANQRAEDLNDFAATTASAFRALCWDSSVKASRHSFRLWPMSMR